MIKPGIEFFITFFALYKVGAVMIMIDPGIGLKSLKTCIGEAQAKKLYRSFNSSCAQSADALVARHNKNSRYRWQKLFLGRAKLYDLRDNNAAEYPTVMMPPDEMAALMFTSGSTGISKGAVYTRHSHQPGTLYPGNLWFHC